MTPEHYHITPRQFDMVVDRTWRQGFLRGAAAGTFITLVTGGVVAFITWRFW